MIFLEMKSGIVSESLIIEKGTFMCPFLLYFFRLLINGITAY